MKTVFQIFLLLAAGCIATRELYADALSNWSLTFSNGWILNSITYGNGRFVAVGQSGTAMVSTTGSDWRFGDIIGSGIDSFNGVCYGKSKFVAVGDYGNVSISSDGIRWTNSNVDLSTDAGPTMYGVAFGNDTFVAVSYQSTLVSSDGVTWYKFYPPAKNLSGIGFAMGTFVIVGDNLCTSTNGRDWVLQIGIYPFEPTPPQPERSGVGYGNGVFVVAGYYSYDGANWAENNLGLSTGIAFGDGHFAAIWGGGVWTSTNGIDWIYQPLKPNSTAYLNSIAFGNKTFVAVAQEGIFGSIYKSDPLIDLSLAVRQGATLSLDAAIGSSYRLEYSDNLIPNSSWKLLTNVTLSSVPYKVLDATSTNSPRRFYRALLTP